MERKKAIKIATMVTGSAIGLAPTAASAQPTQTPVINTMKVVSPSPTLGSGSLVYFQKALASASSTSGAGNGTANFKSDHTTRPITVYDDFTVNTSNVTRYVTASTCRQSWSGISASCGTASSAQYTSGQSGAFELAPTTAGVQSSNNSQYDYYFVSLSVYSPGGSPAIIPNGIGVACW